MTRVRRSEQERLLQELLVRGRWPRSADGVAEQQRETLVPRDVVRRLAADEDRLILMPPPFRTVQDEIEDHGSDFWTTHGALDQIDAANTFVIADFGLGSDAVVVVELTPGRAARVLRLRWASNGNQWVRVAGSVEEFRRAIAIDENS